MPAHNVENGDSDSILKPIYLWFAHPEDALAAPVAKGWAQVLSEAEQARWQQFRFDEGRREYLTTRHLVRSTLSTYGPLSPQAWQFKANIHGKPAVDPDCGLRFNLSNSTRLVVCLIGQEGELGVDIEPAGRAAEIRKLGPDIFSAIELAQLETLSDEEKLDRVLSLWTLKESYIKARGLGLTLPLKKFSFVFENSDGVGLETEPGLDDEPARWRFCLLNLAGHRVALAVESQTEPKLEIWEHRPSNAAPLRQPSGEEKWFPPSK